MASGRGNCPCAGTCLPATTAGELSGGQRAYRVGHHRLTHEPTWKPSLHKGKQQPIQGATIHSVSQRTTLANTGQAAEDAHGHNALLQQCL